MYLDGLEISGLGMGMTFLALGAIWLAILGLRKSLDRAESWRKRRAEGPEQRESRPPTQAPSPEVKAAMPPPGQPSASDKSARAAAIAVALFLAEEEESAEGTQQ